MEVIGFGAPIPPLHSIRARDVELIGGDLQQLVTKVVVLNVLSDLPVFTTASNDHDNSVARVH